MQSLRNFHQDVEGQGLTEYALLLLIIALGAIAGMSSLASGINTEFIKIAGKLT